MKRAPHTSTSTKKASQRQPSPIHFNANTSEMSFAANARDLKHHFLTSRY
jgi:hypothetical protein